MYSDVVSIINLINDEVTKTIEVDFMGTTWVGVLRNLVCEEIEKNYEVVASFMGRGSNTKNFCKLDLDLKN